MQDSFRFTRGRPTPTAHFRPGCALSGRDGGWCCRSSLPADRRQTWSGRSEPAFASPAAPPRSPANERKSASARPVTRRSPLAHHSRRLLTRRGQPARCRRRPLVSSVVRLTSPVQITSDVAALRSPPAARSPSTLRASHLQMQFEDHWTSQPAAHPHSAVRRAPRLASPGTDVPHRC